MRGFTMVVAVLGLSLGACSKHAAPVYKPDESEEAEEGGDDEAPTAQEPVGDIDPEVYDRVTRVFEGKRTAVGRCFSDALAAGKIERKAKGSITFEMRISPAGKATDVHVAKDSLKADEVTECAGKMIESWELPRPASPMPFSFIYNFEEQ